ncbi:MAG: hypothetical protein CMK07_16400 [Ponticaulis sp.]|nr:hypothetical protein [Ponticaulis sp.]
MNLKRRLLSWSAPLVVGSAALAGGQTAWAEGRAVSLDLDQSAGYGRIVASWADGSEAGPEILARQVGPVLILQFDEPVDIDVEALTEGLPNYIAIARQSEDEREVRIALAREYNIHQSRSLDLTAIDLLPETMTSDPPDILSPLVAVKAEQARQAAAAAEAARLAAIPEPLDVIVTGSETDDFSTVAFYWPETVNFQSSDIGDDFQIVFDRRGIADLVHLRIDPPTGLETIVAENTEESFVVDLDIADGYWASAVDVESAVIVRLHPGEKPETEDDVVLPAALQELAENLPDDEGIAPPSRKPPPPQVTEVAETQENEPRNLLPAALQTEAEEPAEIIPVKQPRLWSEAIPSSGKVPVRVVPQARGMEVDLEFAADIPGVVFRRHDAVWIAFPADGSFDLEGLRQATGTRIDEIRSDSGMALRLFLPRDLLIKVNSDGRHWHISIGNDGELADRQIKPTRIAGDGGSGLEAVVEGSGTVFSLEDPEIGDRLIMVPAFNPSTALVQSLSFVDASLPVTAHGLVVAPRTDDLQVEQRGDQVRIRRESGLELSRWGVESNLASRESLSPGFLDFATWREGGTGEFWSSQNRLSAAAARADAQQFAGQAAMMDLAKFFLAWELAAEAYGPLNEAVTADPLLEQDAQWRTLKGAADIMTGRFEDAVKALDHGSVRGDAAASAWLGLAYAEIGEWRKARQSFLQAAPMINAHTPEWAARFHAAAARAMIRMGDGALAETHALAASRSNDEEAQGQARLTLGELALATDRNDDARDIFAGLLNHPSPNVRVRAELADIKLAVEEGRMSNLDAADRLDTLRFRWRGDALELEIVSALVDSYYELGRFREALTLALNFAQEFPNLPGARDLRIKLADQFKGLYLDGKADSLDPISALALYYEFKDLTPIGPDGDRMIRLLAGRLVDFDLLEPATELLAHQVENRNLIGQSRAQIAADLAAIYLLDRRPEKALQTLNTTRLSGLSNELRLERRLLESAAHMELQRYGHAIELLETLDDEAAKELLAEVHWRARSWGAAGRALHRILPDPGAPLSGRQLQTAIRAAVAYRLEGDSDGLSALRAEYLTQIQPTSEGDTFDLLTGTSDVSSTRLSDTVRRLADTTTANAFLSGLKQRFSGAGGSL